MVEKKDGSAEPITRKERAAAELRTRERRETARTRSIWGGVALVLLALVGFTAYGVTQNNDEAALVGLDAVKSYTVEAGHVTNAVSYPQNPPTGGEHNPVWLNCGTYDSPVPNENAVHSMEHGAVWVTYRSNLTATEVEELRSAMPPTYAILSPVEDLPAPVVASAWGKQLLLDGADDKRLKAFLSAYVQGPGAPEPGASCTGGSDGTLPLNVGELMQ